MRVTCTLCSHKHETMPGIACPYAEVPETINRVLEQRAEAARPSPTVPLNDLWRREIADLIQADNVLLNRVPSAPAPASTPARGTATPTGAVNFVNVPVRVDNNLPSGTWRFENSSFTVQSVEMPRTATEILVEQRYREAAEEARRRYERLAIGIDDPEIPF